MNIMEFCLGPGLGGLELYMYKTSVEMTRTDNVCVVISEKGKLADRFTNTEIPIIFFEKGVKNLPLFKAFKLAKVIDDNNIDVIHMHWGRDLSLLALAKWLSKKKPRLVYTRHMQITRSKDDFYHRFLYRQVDVYITITKVLERLSRGFLGAENENKVVLIYHGVETVDKYISSEEKKSLRYQVGFNKSDFLITLFGRIEEHKGQHVFIDAIKVLKEQGHDVKGLIVGNAKENSYLESLKLKVKENHLDKNISFMGFIDNPQEWMQVSNVVLLASKEETFGLVLAEAMQAGVAVIGTNSGGVPEIIEHRKTGLLFEYGDINSLSKYILELKMNHEKCLSYARAGQKKAREVFSLDKHYKKLRHSLYGNLK